MKDIQNTLRKYSFYAATFLSLGMMSGCGSDSNNNTPIETPPIADQPDVQGILIGRIPENELYALSPMTLQNVFDAYESVVADDPALENDEEAAAEAVFLFLKQSLEGQGNSEDILLSRGILDTLGRLSNEEKKVIFSNIFDTIATVSAPDDASTAAVEAFACDRQVQADSKLDALRHAYWNALMARRANSDFAEQLATAHESESSDENSTRMDLHNNAFGRLIEMLNPEATEEELLEILRRERYIQIERGVLIGGDMIGLVYFDNASPLDGRYEGTFTNPDSNTVWNASFDFTQCESEIQGQYNLDSGDTFIDARFAGTWQSAVNMMTLEVSPPFAFEIRPGFTLCRNVVVNLQGAENTFDGFWTSSSCSLGGEISLSR